MTEAKPMTKELRFINEFSNAIVLSVRSCTITNAADPENGDRRQGVEIEMVGPVSNVTNRITYTEASNLLRLLNRCVGTSMQPGQWCQPLDRGNPRPRQFMLWFEDRDRGIALYEDETEALEAWRSASVAWNCYLFSAHPQQPRVTDEEAWLDLVEKTDRTSPADHPDMALITRDELAAYMLAAAPQPPAQTKEGV